MTINEDEYKEQQEILSAIEFLKKHNYFVEPMLSRIAFLDKIDATLKASEEAVKLLEKIKNL